MLTSVVFDLDGTLLNTLEDLTDSLNVGLTHYGFKECTVDEVRKYLGSGYKALIHRALKPIAHNENDEENVLSVFKDEYEERKMNKTHPYFGIIDLINKLKRMGIKVAVLSNKGHDDTLDIVQHFFGEGTFNVICGKKSGVPVKPDPTSLFDVMHELHAHQEETLFVGDSEVDMQTAINANLKKVGCLWGFRDINVLQEYEADYIVSEPSEIIKIVEELHVPEPEIVEEYDDEDNKEIVK